MQKPEQALIDLAKSLPSPIADERADAAVKRWLRHLMTVGHKGNPDDVMKIAAHLHERPRAASLLRAIEDGAEFDKSLSDYLLGNKPGEGRGVKTKAGIAGTIVNVNTWAKDEETTPSVRIAVPKGKKGMVGMWLNESTFIAIVHGETNDGANVANVIADVKKMGEKLSPKRLTDEAKPVVVEPPAVAPKKATAKAG